MFRYTKQMVASLPFQPFVVQLYYGGEVSYTQGVVLGAPGTRTTTFLVVNHMSYTEFLDNICRCVQIDRQSCSLQLTLYYEYNGGSYTSYINQENDMYLVYQLASLVPGYTCKIHVTWAPAVQRFEQDGTMYVEHGSSSTIRHDHEGYVTPFLIIVILKSILQFLINLLLFF